MITERINTAKIDPYHHEKLVARSLGNWLKELGWRAPVFDLSPGDTRTAFHDDFGDAELKAFGERGIVDRVVLTRRGQEAIEGFSIFRVSLTWHANGESDDYENSPWPSAVKTDVLVDIQDQLLPYPLDCGEEVYSAYLAASKPADALEWGWWKDKLHSVTDKKKITERILAKHDRRKYSPQPPPPSPKPPEPPKAGASPAPEATPPAATKAPTAPDSAGRIAYRRASDIQAKPINWLWPGRIARGKVSMLAGNPGLGKSQVTASKAAVVTTGGTWPVDGCRCERGNVIFLSAEDDAEDTIRPRLEAAGADLSRVFILDAVVEAFNAEGGEIRRTFNLKTDLARLGKMLVEIGGAALIVIDPITAYLGETDSHKNAEIRALLAPLGELAAKHGAAIVCVTHLNKSSGGEALMRVTGSLAFVAAARAAFIVAKDPENEARRLFLPMKNNIGNDQTGLAFAIQSAQVKSPAGLIETSRVAWEPDPVTVTADEAMTPQGDPEERSALDDARHFLLGLLADGPVKAGQIKTDADGAGFNWRTIQRAADRLNIERHKNGMKGGWTWKLPPKMTSTPEDDRHETLSPSGSLVAFGEDVPDF